MAKQFWKGSALLAPVPAALVTCGTMDKPNVLTIGWTGIVCTRPPMTYISVRPERFSHDMIMKSGEFVINLTTSAMVKEVDFCGVKSGKDIDKFAKCGFTKGSATAVSCPTIEECPLTLECKVTDIIPMGSHHMFIADIVAVDVDESLIDKNGKLHLDRAGLSAFAHGEYFELGKKIGSFGFSATKKKNKNGRKEK
jgi:flavin reductase (DIM6/NTAB) family NADH-FMN oxidoreductase RutF